MMNKKPNNLQNMVHIISQNRSPRHAKSPNQQNQQNYQRDQSPNKLNATRKPMIHISQSQSKIDFKRQPLKDKNKNTNCVNHPHKNAEFLAKVKGQTIECCQRCAAKMASQGFTVLQTATQFENISNTRPIFQMRKLPSNPKLQNNPLYTQICEVLKYAYGLENMHYQNIQYFTSLQSKFQSQILFTQNYYDELLAIVKQMKQQHIADLYDESKRLTQIGYIEVDYLRDNLTEIQAIIEDIQVNINQIVCQISEKDFELCMGQYKSSLHLFKHNVEQQHQKMKDITFNSQSEIEHKITQVVQFLKKIWNNSNNNQKIVKHPEEITSKPFWGHFQQENPTKVNNNNKQHSAFRTLFNNSQAEQYLIETSPKFKMM